MIAGTDGAARPFWSPDGRSVGFFAGAKLKTIDAGGGPVRILADAPSPRGGPWNRDGVIVFAPSFGDGLYRVSAAGDRPTLVTTLGEGRQEFSHRWPQFLPDGRHFLYLAMNAVRAQEGIFIGSIDSPERVRLFDTEAGAAVTAAGTVFFTRQRALFAQALDQKTARVAGSAQLIADHVGFGHATGESPFSAAVDTLAYSIEIPTPLTRLTWVGRSGQVLGVVGPEGEYENPVLSADGAHIAFHRLDASTGGDVWLSTVAQPGLSRLTLDPATDFAPVWSADSTFIAFGSNRAGTFDLYRKPANGGRDELVAKTSSSGVYPTSWSDDGRFIAFTLSGSRTGFDTWVMPMSPEGKAAPLLETIFNETQAQFSPDGHWIAYTCDETGLPEVFVQSFPLSGAKWQVSSGGGSDPKWRHDGRELFFIAADGRLVAVPVTPSAATFTAGAPKLLFQTQRSTFRGPQMFTNYTPSADGQRFLINRLADDTRRPLPITVISNWTAGVTK